MTPGSRCPPVKAGHADRQAQRCKVGDRADGGGLQAGDQGADQFGRNLQE
jgi:hypothetical protein